MLRTVTAGAVGAPVMRKATVSASVDGWSIVEGLVYVVKGRMPKGLIDVTDPFFSSTPPDDAIHIDGDAWVAAAKRTPPAIEKPDRWDRETLLKKLRWTDAQLTAAISNLGFPAGDLAYGSSAFGSHVTSRRTWRSELVGGWIGVYRSIPAPPKD